MAIKEKKELTREEREALAIKLEGISCSLRLKTIYRTRYGIDDGLVKSNGETGEIFGISREAVRQACEKVESLFTS